MKQKKSFKNHKNMALIKCTECGREISDKAQKCPGCGSPVSQKDEPTNVKYDAKQVFQSDAINQVFKGLKEALDQNIKDQNEYDCDYFATQVYSSHESWLNRPAQTDICIMQITNSDYSYNENARGVRGDISIDMFKFFVDDEARGLTAIQFGRFTKMEEFKLFKKVDDNWYKLDFGQDTKSAAFLVTKILIEVFGFKLTDNLFFANEVECLVSGSVDDVMRWEGNQSKEYKESTNRIRMANSAEKKGNCFIATATMGSYGHPAVIELRHFRDNWILQKSWGEGFVAWYYHYGSIAAKSIEKSFLRLFAQ